MNENNLKRILSVLVFILLLIPVITSSVLDLQKKRENELLLEEQLAQKESIKKAETKIYLMGKFDPSQREDFSPIPAEFNIGGYKMYLRKETLDAFLKMAEAADKDEISLKITSATRNFDYQRNLWNKKWTGATLVDGQDLSKSILDKQTRFSKILEYSAVPGTSRHHWGTDIDINGPTPEYFDSKKGKKEYEWLTQNASIFGFCQTYNPKSAERSSGYNEEKWHWSYMPLARDLTEEYKKLITKEDIKGFDGDAYASSYDLINGYVLSINPDCL